MATDHGVIAQECTNKGRTLFKFDLDMKIRTVKKVIKEFMIKGRKTPLARKVTLEHIAYFHNKDHIK